MVIDSRGMVYGTEDKNNWIQKFTPEGEFLMMIRLKWVWTGRAWTTIFSVHWPLGQCVCGWNRQQTRVSFRLQQRVSLLFRTRQVHYLGSYLWCRWTPLCVQSWQWSCDHILAIVKPQWSNHTYVWICHVLCHIVWLSHRFLQLITANYQCNCVLICIVLPQLPIVPTSVSSYLMSYLVFHAMWSCLFPTN